MNFSRTLIRLLIPGVLYLDKTSVVLNREGARQDENAAQKTCRAAILGKRTYFETIAEFPFDDTREIKAAVRLAPSDYAPFETDLFFMRKIGRRQDRTRVNLWLVRPRAAELIRQSAAWFVFPETALWTVAKGQTPRIECIERETDRLLVHVDAQGGVRSSLDENGSQASLETFQRSLGAQGAGCDIEQVSCERPYHAELLTRLFDAPVSNFLPFLRLLPAKTSFDARFARRAGAGLAALFLVYGALWAGLPMYLENRLARQNNALSDELGQVINRQSDIEAIKERIQTLSGPVADYLPKLPLFNLLYDCLSGSSVIKRMNVSGRRVEIEGTAPSASAMISTLSAKEAFANVRLTKPLKKDRNSGHDVFSVSLYVTPGAFVEKPAPREN